MAGFAITEGGLLVLSIAEARGLTGYELYADAVPAGLSAPYTLTGLDTLPASVLLRRLRDRRLLDLHPRGASSYYTLPKTLLATPDRGEQQQDRGEPPTDRGEPPTDRGEPPTDRGELAPDREEHATQGLAGNPEPGDLPPGLQAEIPQLGKRPRQDNLRRVVEAICAERPWTNPVELAGWLLINPRNLTDRHLSPMVREGRLERRFPDTPTHAAQAYRSTHQQLPFGHHQGDQP